MKNRYNALVLRFLKEEKIYSQYKRNIMKCFEDEEDGHHRFTINLFQDGKFDLLSTNYHEAINYGFCWEFTKENDRRWCDEHYRLGDLKKYIERESSLRDLRRILEGEYY